MGALSEEHTGRTVELRYDNALRTIDDECTLLGHIRDWTEIHILNCCVEVLVVGVRAIKLELSLQRHTICETATQTFIYRIARGIDIIIKKLQDKVITGVCNREILCKHLIKPLILTHLGGSVKLEEILERFQLNFQEVRKRKRILNRREINARFFG